MSAASQARSGFHRRLRLIRIRGGGRRSGRVPANRRRLAALLLPVLVVAACDEAPAPTTTVPPTTSTTETVETQVAVYDLLGLANHPNGAQLRIDRVELFPSSTVVTGHLINGSALEISVGAGTTELRTGSGLVASLVDPFEPITLAPASEASLTLLFGPIPADTDSVTLGFNQGGGSSPASTTATVPSFDVGPIGLGEGTTRPALPDPVPVSTALTDTAGVELRVEGINFTETRVGLAVRLTNPTGFEARITPSLAPTVLVDDLGNRYTLVLPEGETTVTIPRGGAVAGTLVFAGRIHPQAASLGLGINVGTESRVDRDRIFPEFVVRDIPLTGAASRAVLPNPTTVELAASHPASVEVSVTRVGFTDSTIEVGLEAANSRDDSVALAAAGTFLLDDIGNAYPLVRSTANPEFVIPESSATEATLAFAGRIADDATAVTLYVNEGRSVDDPDTREPALVIGPVAFERSDAPREVIEAQVFVVGLRTRVEPAELVVSEIDRITQTLQEFDATDVDGGFRLTLPDSILFDFGSSELRGDSAQALTLIAEVLEFYADAEIVVVGHTDSVGSATANQRLSEQRAQSVVDALVDNHGVLMERMSAEGRGADEPVADNTNPDGSDNPEGRQLNRRVEIVVLTDEPVELP